MKKALIKTHIAAGKNSKGKNLIKKRFPKLSKVSKISTVGGGGSPTFSTSGNWVVSDTAAGSATNSVTITSSLSNFPITLRLRNAQSVTTACNGDFFMYVNTILNQTIPDNTICGFNSSIDVSTNLNSGSSLSFQMPCPNINSIATIIEVKLFYTPTMTQIGNTFIFQPPC